ncbi:hypothetical protein LX16_0051 [Stackebrandtia albiflava]|uniref:MMPL family protein n=2 Tax=Stackebrandtia albiflava TaxID=406432 RepID=A0A562VGW1_9ACTN|nr:hypothetical protein LX16_0051 [Stackebrandtia albiflava]
MILFTAAVGIVVESLLHGKWLDIARLMIVGALCISALMFVLLPILITLFNRPRFLIPPRFRGQAGIMNRRT